MPEVPPELASLTVYQLLLWVFFAMAIVGVVSTIRKKVKPFFDKLHQFLEDWSGEAARPGVPARPGVMARLAAVEHELKPNGGSSFYDKLIKRDKERDARSEELAEQIAELADTVKRHVADCCKGKAGNP